MKKRPFSGTIQIIQFNWPFYLIGLLVLGGLLGLLLKVSLPTWANLAMWLGFVGAAWWFVASLVVSYWVYDASSVMTGGWLDSFLGNPGRERKWAVMHAGLDQATPGLAEHWGPPHAVLDIFDADEMTEPSIRRARNLAKNSFPAEPTSYRRLPQADASVDAVCIVFAAHELRSGESRSALFCEIYRVLVPGGSVLIVEHLRDVANFVAFGPGFMHFLPDSTWRAVPEAAGFRLVERIRNTPFVAAYHWVKP